MIGAVPEHKQKVTDILKIKTLLLDCFSARFDACLKSVFLNFGPTNFNVVSRTTPPPEGLI